MRNTWLMGKPHRLPRKVCLQLQNVRAAPAALLSQRQLIMPLLFRAGDSRSLSRAWDWSHLLVGKSQRRAISPGEIFTAISKFTLCCGLRHDQTRTVESRSLKGLNYYVNFLLFIPLYALLLWPPASNTPFLCFLSSHVRDGSFLILCSHPFTSMLIFSLSATFIFTMCDRATNKY